MAVEYILVELRSNVTPTSHYDIAHLQPSTKEPTY